MLAKIYLNLLFLILFTFAINEASALDQNSNIETYLKSAHANICKLESLEFTCEIENRYSEEIKLEKGEKREFVSKFKFFFKGSSYRVEMDTQNATGEQFETCVYANNGKISQYFERKFGYLYIKKIDDKFIDENRIDPRAAEFNLVFRPYAFLKNMNLSPMTYYLLKDYKDWEFWRDSLNRMQASTTSMESDVIKFDFQDKTEVPFIEIKGDIIKTIVFFKKDVAPYPIKWERYSLENNLIWDYEIKNLKQIDGFIFPEVAVEQFYGKNGKVGTTSIMRVTSIKINNLDDDVFEIDPSSAHLIKDVDAGTTIVVPQ
jgi:hypothetical protein